jgi:hypothetical protein
MSAFDTLLRRALAAVTITLTAAACVPIPPPGQYVVTLGRDVTHASHFDFAPPYTWMPRHARGAGGCMNQYHQTWAHHTSGRSYFWNDPMNVVQAKRFWERLGIEAVRSN